MKNNRKGFTIVELIIVIAVIAILAATLIPTFSNVIKKANISADTQIVRNLNNALDIETAGKSEPNTLYEANEIVKSYGYDVSKMAAKNSEMNILWNSKTHRFVLVEGDEYIYPTTSETVTGTVSNKIDYFKVSNTIEEEYSTYYIGTDKVITTSKGFDVGDNTDVETVNYINGTSNTQNVILRTNSSKTNINVNEVTGDKIKHYGLANKLTITHLTTNSYHEYGKLAIAYITEGRVVAEDKGVIEIAYISDESAYAQEVNSGVINLAYASTSTVKTASDTPDSTNGLKKELIYEPSITSENVANVVARIGSKGYENIQDAFDLVQENEVIYLTRDVESNKGYQYSKNYISTIDLNGYTLKVTGSNSSIDGGRAIKITSGKLIAKNGTVDGRSYNTDGTPNDNQSSTGPWSATRTGGCFRLSGGDAELENLTMYNNDGWGNCIKMESDNRLIMRNCTVNSVYGAGLEQGYGVADLYNCKFIQTGKAASKYISTCFAVCGLGTLNLHNVTASQDVYNNGYGTYVLYVYNSGGVINVDGGQFVSKGEAVIHIDGATPATFHEENEGIEEDDNAIFSAFIANHDGKSSIININGGRFDGDVYVSQTGDAASYALLKINAGTFSNSLPTINVQDNR